MRANWPYASPALGGMSVGTQAEFLRVLEGHPFERVGGSTPIRADVRILAATNPPLEQAVHGGTFRKDLFFRRADAFDNRPGSSHTTYRVSAVGSRWKSGTAPPL